MVIDMNYWTRVIKRIAVLLFSLVLIYFSFKLAIFYIPFLIGFLISQLMDPLIKYVTKKTGMNRKTSAIWVLLIAFTILIILIVIGIITIISESSRFITRTKLLY
ncbi:MAG: hypothetical protein ACI4VE_06590 [Clostridia bacterium]